MRKPSTIGRQAHSGGKSAAHVKRLVLDDFDYAQSIAGIARGLQSSKRGKGRPMRAALEAIGRRYGIDLRSA